MRMPWRLAPFRTRLHAVLMVVILAAVGLEAYAQDLEPRAYVNTPVGLNFLLAGYGYAAGGVATDPSLPLQNAYLQVHSALLAYARSLDVWGMSGKIDVVVPYAWLSGSTDFEGQPREREVSGFANPRFRFSVNFYGAPALYCVSLRVTKQDLIIGASLQVAPPLGQYDADKLVNIGTNRWSFKPELGISKALGPLTRTQRQASPSIPTTTTFSAARPARRPPSTLCRAT